MRIVLRLRCAFLKTRLKDAASASRLSVVKRSSMLLTIVALLFLPLVIEQRGRYGVSCARPFARRRFNTRRPAFVAIRALNPWVRARLILLG